MDLDARAAGGGLEQPFNLAGKRDRMKAIGRTVVERHRLDDLEDHPAGSMHGSSRAERSRLMVSRARSAHGGLKKPVAR